MNNGSDEKLERKARRLALLMMMRVDYKTFERAVQEEFEGLTDEEKAEVARRIFELLAGEEDE